MKKKILSLYITLIVLSSSALAQHYTQAPNQLEYDEAKWHFGFTLGPEFQNFRISNNSQSFIDDSRVEITDPEVTNAYFYSEVQKITPGFHVGIITSRRLGNYFNLRIIPSLSLGQREVKSIMYTEKKVDGEYQTTPGDNAIITTTNIKSTYINVPVLIKYKAVRINNVRPYLVAGGAFKYDLATDFEDPITLKKVDASLELGMGSDFYLETFRFGIEVRFGIGLLNVLQSDRPSDDNVDNAYLTSSIDRIRSKMFTIALNFE